MKIKANKIKIVRAAVILIIAVVLILPSMLYQKESTNMLSQQVQKYASVYGEEYLKINGTSGLKETKNKEFKDNLNTGIGDMYQDDDIGYELYKIETHFDTNNKLYISTRAQLKALAYYVNYKGNNCEGKTIILLNNINLGKITDWDPIGTSSTNGNFEGTFEGNHNILSFDMTDVTGINKDVIGLFGYIGKNGTVNELTVQVTGTVDDDINITNCGYFGLLAGINNGNVIECSTSLSWYYTTSNYQNFLAFCNKLKDNDIEVSFSTTTLSTKNIFIGQPLIGKNNGTKTNNSYDKNSYADENFSEVSDNNFTIEYIKVGNTTLDKNNTYVNEGDTIEICIKLPEWYRMSCSYDVYGGDGDYCELLDGNYASHPDDINDKLYHNDRGQFWTVNGNDEITNETENGKTFLNTHLPKVTFRIGSKDVILTPIKLAGVKEEGKDREDKLYYQYTYNSMIESDTYTKIEYMLLDPNKNSIDGNLDCGYYETYWLNEYHSWNEGRYYFKNDVIRLNNKPSISASAETSGEYKAGDEIIIKVETNELVKNTSNNPNFIVGFGNNEYDSDKKLNFIDTELTDDEKIIWKYSYALQPQDEGLMKIKCTSGSITDLGGNTVSLIGTSYNLFDVQCAPVPTIKFGYVDEYGDFEEYNKSETSQNEFAFEIDFGEEVTGFSIEDISFSEEDLIEIKGFEKLEEDGGYAQKYLVICKINESTDTEVTLTIPNECCTDRTGNNNNETTLEFSIKEAPKLTGFEVYKIDSNDNKEEYEQDSNYEIITKKLKAGDIIQIEAIYSENIELKDKATMSEFGSISFNGKQAKGTIGTGNINENKIRYRYTIQSGDSGKLKIDNYVLPDLVDSEGYTVEESNINYDTEYYIEADNTAPEISDITFNKTGVYGIGEEIEITATFKEDIYANGEISPTITFGSTEIKGEIDSLDTEAANEIKWKYTIVEGDNGYINVKVEGNTNIKDIAGNTFTQEYDLLKNKTVMLYADTEGPELNSVKADTSKINLIFTDRIKGTGSITYKFGENGEEQTKEFCPESAIKIISIKDYIPEGVDGDLIITDINVEYITDEYDNKCKTDNIKDFYTTYSVSVDNIKPTLESMELKYQTESGYFKAGEKINIVTYFSEIVTGNVTLKIKFGEYERTITKENIEASEIEWEYTISEGDNGEFSIESLDVSSLEDTKGNDFDNTEISDMIEEVNNNNTGIIADTKAPKLTKIEIVDLKTNGYIEYEEITIRATIDENIDYYYYYYEEPTLSLMFGDKEAKNKAYINYTSEENIIEWTYTVHEKDKGTLSIESINVESVTDKAGNVCTLAEGLTLEGGAKADTDIPTVTITAEKILSDGLEEIKSYKTSDREGYRTNADKIRYTIIFSEKVTGFNINNIEIYSNIEELITLGKLSNEIDNYDGTYSYTIDLTITEEDYVKIESDTDITLIINGSYYDAYEENTYYILDEAGNKIDTTEQTITIDKFLPTYNSYDIKDEYDEYNYVEAFRTGDNISISILFDEYIKLVEGNLPKLKISFIENDKTIKFATLTDPTYKRNKITWTYTVKEGDIGSVKIDSIEGQVYDLVGNSASSIKIGEENCYNVDAQAPALATITTDWIYEEAYKEGQIIIIRAEFNEEIDYGTVTPKIMFKETQTSEPVLGQGNLVEYERYDNTISWEYTIGEGDSGTLICNELEVNIVDNNGNITEGIIECDLDGDKVIVDSLKPILTSLVVIEPTTGIYGIDKEIKIKATFNKKVDGYPELRLLFGENEAQGYLSEEYDERTDNTITWIYTIVEGDNGKLTLDEIVLSDTYDCFWEQFTAKEDLTLGGPEIVADTESRIIFKTKKTQQVDGKNYIKVSASMTEEKIREDMDEDSLIGYNPDFENLSDEWTLKTGTEIKLNGEVVYTVVVIGDVNCDGKVGPIDVTTANSIRLGKAKASVEQELAADYNSDGKVAPVDITNINSYRLGKIK